MNQKIVLASASPRRRDLMQWTGLDFEICPVDADEQIPEGMLPAEAVQLLALRKACEAANMNPDGLIIGADTVVALDAVIFGKPVDPRDAQRILKILSGKTHQVYTGVALVQGDRQHTFAVKTDVTFYPLTDRQIDDYIATGEPMDKAGAYGIQGYGGLFVEKINGCYNNVVGLPVAALMKALDAFMLR